MEFSLISYMVVKKKVPRMSFQKHPCWIIQSRILANHLLREIKKVCAMLFLQNFYLWPDFLDHGYVYNSKTMQLDTVYLLLCARSAFICHQMPFPRSSAGQIVLPYIVTNLKRVSYSLTILGIQHNILT